MLSPILQRIVRRSGVPQLLDAVSELAPSELTSLLLHVYRTRVAKLRPADLLAQWERGALVSSSSAEARLLHEAEQIAFAAAPGFDPLTLSPVQPLGTSAVLGGIDQNNVLTTIRGAEVVADPTGSLALECAHRRRLDRATEVRLCAAQRTVRLQRVDVPGFSPHFGLFVLATAGRDQDGCGSFELAALHGHVVAHLRVLEGLRARGFGISGVSLQISDTNIIAALVARAGIEAVEIRQVVRAHAFGAAEALLARAGVSLPRDFRAPLETLADLPGCAAARVRLARVRDEIIAPLARSHPQVPVRIDLGRLEGLNYYEGLCFRVTVHDAAGVAYPVADGGFPPWTERLLGDRRERFLASGLGLEFLVKRLGPQREGGI